MKKLQRSREAHFLGASSPDSFFLDHFALCCCSRLKRRACWQAICDEWFWENRIRSNYFLDVVVKNKQKPWQYIILTAIVVHSIEVELLGRICNLKKKKTTLAQLQYFGKCIFSTHEPNHTLGPSLNMPKNVFWQDLESVNTEVLNFLCKQKLQPCKSLLQH